MTDDDTTEEAGTPLGEMFDGMERPTNIEIPDGKTEADTERDGLLSYAGEWHALILGIGAGATYSPTLVGMFLAYVFGKCHLLGILSPGSTGEKCPLKETGHMEDAAKEPGYSIAGVLLGLALNAIFIGTPLLGGGF